jgi:tRNA threonylcarbamoyladenosine biosynthesis protein TsaE
MESRGNRAKWADSHAQCRVEPGGRASYNRSVAGFETSLTLRDEAATAELGARIAAALAPGDVVALSGELGAGKTALARAILRGRGVGGHVPSPTFTLVQAYETPGLTLHHFDFYRIERASELSELGLEDAVEGGAVLVEWPERGMPAYLTADALLIGLELTGETIREARISGPARWRNVFFGGPIP